MCVCVCVRVCMCVRVCALHTCLPFSTSMSTTRPSAPHETIQLCRVLKAMASTRPVQGIQGGNIMDDGCHLLE